MNKLRAFSSAGLLALAIFLIQGCSFSTANLGTLKTSTDKEGKNEATTFKAGDTIYARANVANNPGKVKIKFTMVPESDLEDMKKGESIKELERSFDMDGDGVATYNFTPTAAFPGGTFKINAEMLNEANESKDRKSATVTIVGESQ
jgi:hypothetical protein